MFEVPGVVASTQQLAFGGRKRAHFRHVGLADQIEPGRRMDKRQRGRAPRKIVLIDSGAVGRVLTRDVKIVLHHEWNACKRPLRPHVSRLRQRLAVHGGRDCIEPGIKRQGIVDGGLGEFERRHFPGFHQCRKSQTIMRLEESPDIRALAESRCANRGHRCGGRSIRPCG